MIASLSHASNLQIHVQRETNSREVVDGAPLSWGPTSDPREIVRRQEFLESCQLPHFLNGDTRYAALRAYCRALAGEVATAEKGGATP